MYYVYALIDIRINKPFYIGKGKIKNNQHEDHFNETLLENSNRHKLFKINYLQKNNYTIPVKILANYIADETDAYKIETYFIKKYGRKNIDKNGILTNICLDNNPPSWKGKKQSKTHIINRVESYKKTCRIIGRKPHSPETKKKIGEKVKGEKNGFYGKTHSIEWSIKHSNRMKGNKNNSKTYKFVSPDQIQYLVTGEFYKFCDEHNLTRSTMEKNLKMNKISTSGKCKGWKVSKLESHMISNEAEDTAQLTAASSI